MPAWVPAAIAAGASIFGGERANRLARQESQRNRDFQERMSNSSYQRAVADMKAAGINPAAAMSHGGASSPSGSMAGQGDSVSPGVSSAMAAQRLAAETKLINAQAKQQETLADKTDMEFLLERMRVVAYGARRMKDGEWRIDVSGKHGQLLRRELMSRIGLNEAQSQTFIQRFLMNEPLIQAMQGLGETAGGGNPDAVQAMVRVLLSLAGVKGIS